MKRATQQEGFVELTTFEIVDHSYQRAERCSNDAVRLKPGQFAAIVMKYAGETIERVMRRLLEQSLEEMEIGDGEEGALRLMGYWSIAVRRLVEILADAERKHGLVVSGPSFWRSPANHAHSTAISDQTMSATIKHRTTWS